jgi:hypothetical protein
MVNPHLVREDPPPTLPEAEFAMITLETPLLPVAPGLRLRTNTAEFEGICIADLTRSGTLALARQGTGQAVATTSPPRGARPFRQDATVAVAVTLRVGIS